MEIHGIDETLAEHPVFRDFDAEARTTIAGCGRNERFGAGETIYSEGDDADKVFILRSGDVSIEIMAPQKGALVVETLHAGDILGWGWLVPPFRTMADARATSDVSAVSLDANCVRNKCEENPALGYQMFKLWLPRLADRVRAQRLQLLDLYGSNGQ